MQPQYQPQAQYHYSLGQEEREKKLTEIIYRHREILTPSEASSLSWKESIFWGSFMYTVISPFYTLYMFNYIKKFPQFRDAGLRRIFAMPLIAVGMLAISGKNMQTYTN